jgi:hypothetical protein
MKGNGMKTTHIILAAISLTLASAQAFAQDAPTAEQCDAWLAKADTNSDGSIGKGENVKFIEMMSKASTTVKKEDTIIDKASFMEECQKGTFGMPAG